MLSLMISSFFRSVIFTEKSKFLNESKFSTDFTSRVFTENLHCEEVFVRNKDITTSQEVNLML